MPHRFKADPTLFLLNPLNHSPFLGFFYGSLLACGVILLCGLVIMKEKKADLVLRVGQMGGVVSELKCAVYDTGSIHESDALADIDKLLWYLSSEGFSYAYFCMLAEFEKPDKLKRIRERLRLTLESPGCEV